MLALGLLILNSIFWSCAVAAGQSGASPQFEVADVKASKHGTVVGVGQEGFQPGGRFRLLDSTLNRLIAIAYDINPEFIIVGPNIVGGPNWIDSDKFDLIAKAPPTTPSKTMRLMLQSLLPERLGLVVHNEVKTLPVYALTVGKRGLKLNEAKKPADPDDCDLNVVEGLATYTCQNITMAQLAENLPQVAGAYLDHPVIDLTGLAGVYQVAVPWTPQNLLFGIGPGPDPSRPSVTVAPAGTGKGNGLTIFDAVDRQLGLKLERGKHPVPVLVVDDARQIPTEN